MVQGIFAAILTSALLACVHGHGRLMDPPNRSSVWRIPEFQHLNPPPNYEDNQLNCGGAGVQYNENEGKCGVCGDAFNLPKPRANELGGFYYRGIIGRNYKAGQTFEIDVHLTASHMGYFQFRICNMDKGVPEEQECFDENLLELEDGGTNFPIPAVSGHYYPKVKLPSNLTCNHCVLQWHYRAGNNWGYCDDGSGRLGCGPQETFRACADISIEPTQHILN